MPHPEPDNEAECSDDRQPAWIYPTRFCRICREDVPPTVTMYPPGLPLQFQRPTVDYKNEDEYGRLIKPCMCRGSSRYIHELCLRRSRTENNRVGSMWKCHECGYKFNFQKLAVQRFLSSRLSAAVVTILVMLITIFVFGFIADPILNLYLDPYDTITGKESLWGEYRVVRTSTRPKKAGWNQHFLKGVVSMSVLGFIKTMALNPWQWFNLRQSGLMTSRTAVTGRDRAVNISWVTLLIGIASAFYFLYRWVEALIQKSLQRVANNIVDTQLPGDDDDLRPPPGWKPALMESAQTQEQREGDKAAADWRFLDSDASRLAENDESRSVS